MWEINGLLLIVIIHMLLSAFLQNAHIFFLQEMSPDLSSKSLTAGWLYISIEHVRRIVLL